MEGGITSSESEVSQERRTLSPPPQRPLSEMGGGADWVVVGVRGSSQVSARLDAAGGSVRGLLGLTVDLW